MLLDWTRGPGAEACPSEPELIEDVERSLGRRAFADRARADRVLHVDIQRAGTPPRWLARIALATPNGRKLGSRDLSIESTSCEEASESLVLALALMIDLPPTPEELEDERAKRAAPWHLSGRLGPSVAVDSSLGGGAHASVVLVPGRFWPVSADAFVSSQRESEPAGRSVQLVRTMLGLGVCPLTVRAARLVLAGCVGPQAELVVAWGTGFGRDRTGTGIRFGGLVQASATYKIGDRVHAFATIGVAATPQRLDFTVLDDRGVERTAYRGSPVTALGSFGLAFDFF